MFRINDETTNEQVGTADNETEARREARSWASETGHVMRVDGEVRTFRVLPDGPLQSA